MKLPPELKGSNNSSLASLQSLAHLPKEYNPNSFNDAYYHFKELIECEQDNLND